jgi:intracellular sulfur oxidation DsrE/DsrF family protein
MATAPYFKNGKWYIDVDPDDRNYVVANVGNDLTDRATTASSVVCILNGVTVLEGPAAQGALMVALITVDQVANLVEPSITFRVTCANGERFDRTIWLNLEDH